MLLKMLNPEKQKSKQSVEYTGMDNQIEELAKFIQQLVTQPQGRQKQSNGSYKPHIH